MAIPPPPYSDITGISRAVMKDNAQETLANYNGNARPGELVVNLVVDPPTVWIGNNSGQLTQISSGGGGSTGDWVFSAGNATTSTDVNIYVTGYPGQGASVNSDEWAQLYWSANVLGNVNVFNPDSGGDLYSWAYVDNNGFTVQYEDDANVVNHEWRFTTTGNLTLPNGGAVVFEGGDGFITKDGDDLLISWDDEELVLRSVNGDVQLEADNDIEIRSGYDFGTGDYGSRWIFNNNGELQSIPQDTANSSSYNGGYIQFVGNSSGDGGGYTTLQLIPDDTRVSGDQYLIIDPTAPGHIHIRAGGTQDASFADLFVGGENSYFKVAAGSNALVQVTANSHSWNFWPGGYAVVPTTDTANLELATVAGVGARAFVTDADSQTFANTVVGGGGNAVPVYSDGTVWRIG